MKTANLKCPWQNCGRAILGPRALGAGLLAALLLAAGNLPAQPSVATLSGGPSAGYVDGNTQPDALFHTPLGMALGTDPTAGSILYVADRDNNAIRKLDLDQNLTITFLTSRISKPVGVALDNGGNLYVLNSGNGVNGNVLSFNRYGNFLRTNAVALTNANGFVLDGSTNMYVVGGKTIVKITVAGVKTVLATITAANTSLRGITLTSTGNLAVTDAGNHGIYIVNPSSGAYYALTGFAGAGDAFGAPGFAKFNQPYGIGAAGSGWLVVADYGNHRVKTVDPNGNVCSLYGVCSNNWLSGPGLFPGWFDGNGCPCEITCQICNNYAEARYPASVMVGTDGSVYTTEIFYHVIRQVTSTGLQPPPPFPPVPPSTLSATATYGQVALAWTPVAGATSYNVKRSITSGGPYGNIANVSTTNYVDTSVFNGNTYYYVVSALNPGGESANSSEVSATVPLPPVPTPQIGYVDYPPTSQPIAYTSVFHPGSSFVFNNNVDIVIVGTAGSQTFYTFGTTGSVPDPTTNSASAPVGYTDGLTRSTVEGQYKIIGDDKVLPDMTVKAIGVKDDGSPNSAVAQTRFQFVTANPTIIGNNAASFIVSNITDGAVMWYTLDGTDPTNAAPSLGGVLSGTQLSLDGNSDFIFKVRAFRDNYKPSGIVSVLFSSTNFVPNKITFGRTNGEPSSHFLARPGQFFYAPVTLQLQPGGETMYSLQFNVTVTNGLATTNRVVNGAGIDFFSMLMTQVDPEEGRYFPPASGQWYLPIPPLTFTSTNSPLIPTLFVNTNNNLLGVSWLYRTGFKYKASDTNGNVILDFDTTKQDLISFSIPHDTLFQKSGGTVVVGAYSFQVPQNAIVGDKYFMQLGSPSATRDGVGAPGADIYIRAPSTNQVVTVGNPVYLVGDAAPFRWLNAGDFGDSLLDNADVMQVYQGALSPSVDPVPANSDLFAALDSSGRLGVWDASQGYYTDPGAGGNMSPGQLQAMYDGNDLTINTNAFGDGVLDISDVYVTLRRSLDPSLVWFNRSWTNGQFVAVPTPNLAYNSNTPSSIPPPTKSARLGRSDASGYAYQDSFVSFTAGDAIVSPGQTVQIPITAQIFGSYPLRVLGLNLTVRPLDGSPALTLPIQFTPSAGLGAPAITSSKDAANYVAAWLDSSIAGLTGNAVLGTLTITIPANATSSSAYAIHFDHASASPNGLASFPKKTQTGLITLSSRSASIYNDGIPDSWRLRYFGTVYNLLSQASADADGDGMNNWQEYVAGTDPTDPASMLSLTPAKGTPQNTTAIIRWPSVLNRQYVIERSATLFPALWSAISTNTGTGGDMEFQDSTGGGSRFYRVRVAQ